MRILVPISSKKADVFFDPACEVFAGEHDFITKDSFAHYKHIQQRSSSKIELCIGNGAYVGKANVSTELLKRITDGIMLSDFVEPWVLDFFQ
jgi:hypothetical protein